MPRRALRCVVDLNIQRVSAPGVWLPSREDCYVSISVFGQYRNTRNVTSVFPLILHEPFRFEKTYYTAVDPQDVSEFLEDELVVIELLQYSDYSDGAIRLASYSTSAREFLFPYPTLCPSYTSTSREALLSRTIAWPGISPKLEFTTKTVIKESRSPELDALEDALEEEKLARRARSRSRSRTRSCSVTRSRSLSRTRSCSDDASLCIRISRSGSRTGYRDESLSDTETGKAPFVVRHLEKSLIGRTPGSPAKKTPKSKKKKTRSRPSSARDGYVSDTYEYTVIRDSDGALPVYSSRYASDDDDLEVAELTSRRSYSPVLTPRPRSTSPYLYKTSYTTRFTRPLSPALTAAERLEIELAVERARARARARALARSISPLPRSISPLPKRYSPSLSDELIDLEIDTELARRRRYYTGRVSPYTSLY